MAQLNSLIVTGDSRFLNTINGNITSSNAIHRATMDSSSTATAFVLTADGIDLLYDGLIITCKNIKIASASGCTINLNGLGAKSIWLSQANSACTTHWGLNQTYMFIYDEANTRWELQQGRDTDGNDTSTLRTYYSNPIAGGNGVKQYSLFAMLKDGSYSSFTTNNGTGTKTFDTTNYFDIRKIYYHNNKNNIASGSYLADNTMSQQENLIDARYTFNGITTSAGFTANKPVYMVFSQGECDNGFYKIKEPYFIQEIDSSSTQGIDNSIYILIGYAHNTYQITLLAEQIIFENLPIYNSGSLITQLRPFKPNKHSMMMANTLNISSICGPYSTTEGVSAAIGVGSHAEGMSGAVGMASHAEGAYAVSNGDGSHAEGSYTCAVGGSSHAEGGYTIAYGNNSHAEGNYTCAVAWQAHAEGSATTANGASSHVEGALCYAAGDCSHSEGNSTTAKGNYSHSEGTSCYAAGACSHSEGNITTALGNCSHSEGGYTCANGTNSHAEGYKTSAYNVNSHSEGESTKAYGSASHAEGYQTCANANYAHAEGRATLAVGEQSHTEGYKTTANNSCAHAEGYCTSANAVYSHTEGQCTYASGNYSHAEGYYTTAFREGSHTEGSSTCAGAYSHAEGYMTTAINTSHSEGASSIAQGSNSHSEGNSTTAYGQHAHAEGYKTYAKGFASHAEGGNSYANGETINYYPGGYAYGDGSHAEGRETCAYGAISHAEGRQTTAFGECSHAEGYFTYASNNYCHAEGFWSKATGYGAHAEGDHTVSSNYYCHAEGTNTTAKGNYSHAEGGYTYASNYYCHAEGAYTTANGYSSHTEGAYTCATGDYQHIEGKYNIPDANMAHIIGGGTNASNKKNIFTVDWNGNVTAEGRTKSKIFNEILTGTGTAGQDKGSGVSPRYFPAKWTFNTGLTATDGDIVTIKIPVAGHSYGVYMSIDNGTTYYPVNRASTDRLTTQFAVNTYITVVFEPTGSTAGIYPVTGGDATSTVTGGIWRIINFYDTDGNDTTTLRSYYSHFDALANGLKQYSLFARVLDGANTGYSSFTTNNGTGTKTFDTTHYFDIRKIYYLNNSGNIASGGRTGDQQVSIQENNVDGRYTFNSITTSAGFTTNKPIYMVFDKSSPSYNCYKIKSPYWTHTPNDTTAIYILIGYARDTYRFSLLAETLAFEYKDSTLVPFKVGGGEGQITNVLPITETDYNALQNKDNLTIYNVIKDNKALTLFSSQGDRRIASKDISNYEFWYENLIFAPNTTAENAKVDPSIYTDIKLFSSANINRDWKLEFKVTPDSYGGGSENAIIGTTGTDTSLRYEIYAPKSDAPNFPMRLYGRFGSDSNVGNIAGKDVVIMKSGRTLVVTADGTQITSTTLSTTTTESNDYKMNIGNYRKYHTFCGIIHYIGFMWLN